MILSERKENVGDNSSIILLELSAKRRTELFITKASGTCSRRHPYKYSK